MEQEKVFLTNSQKSSCEEIYFFSGKKSVLCISKQENKVLERIQYAQTQITIISPSEFSITINNNKNLLLYCGEECPTLLRKTPQTEKEIELSDIPEDTKYKFKAICDGCNRKKCSQYDTINGRNFQFGEGRISEDMLQQYDNYCKQKIEKFNCV